MQIKSANFELHPAGNFLGEITNISQDISKYNGKQQLVFTIATTPIDGERTERTILQWTSTSLSPRSKLGRLYMAVSGEEIHAGLEIDTDQDLLHKNALVVVEHYQKEDGQTGNRVSDWKQLN